MGVIGFALKLVWTEVKDRILPNLKDIITAIILTVFFGLTCHWMLMGGVIFFVISLILVYLTSRLAAIVRTILRLNRMRKNMGGVIDSIGFLKNTLKK